MIRVKEGPSYFQSNFSSKKYTERNVLKTIIVAELVESTTRAQYGSAIR